MNEWMNQEKKMAREWEKILLEIVSRNDNRNITNNNNNDDDEPENGEKKLDSFKW